MSRSVQRRRGTTAEHATFTGALAELTVDTTKDTVVVHDGAVAGGYPLLRQDLSNLPAGTIDNADISASAEIAVSKLANGTARQLLQTDAAGTGVEFASNIDVPGTLDVTSAATFDNNVIIQGDLTVNGTETIINTQTLEVEDKNIIVGKVVTPSDVTADGGGITLKGTTDKTINWIDATDAWTLSEHVNIASAKEYRIDGTKALDATSLGSGVTSSSLTSVGTIGTGTWQGTAINKTYLDATLVSTADTGTVTSTMILDGTILNADINASAAIVDTKLATIATAGKVSGTAITSGNISTSGSLTSTSTITGANLIPTGSGVPTNGIYLPAANQVAVATNGTGRLFVDASGNVQIAGNLQTGVSATTGQQQIRFNTQNTYAGQIYTNNLENLWLVAGAIYDGTNFVANTGTAAAMMRIVQGAIRFETNSSLTPSGNFTPQERLRIDSSGRLLVGTSSARSGFYNAAATTELQVEGDGEFSVTRNANDGFGGSVILAKTRSSGNAVVSNGDVIGNVSFQGNDGSNFKEAANIKAAVDGTPGANDMPGRLVFSTTADGASTPTERMRIDSGGNILIGQSTTTTPGSGNNTVGICLDASGTGFFSRAAVGLRVNRTADGAVVAFASAGTEEGNISISGTTTSYNGAHLSRWSQLSNNAERIEILRGSVLSNIDEMCEWGEEDNEQLNRMKVSDVEGDKNVSGVFQDWDDDDDTYTDDFYCAMTGDFIIRIAEGVTVERGDLLMSAGDGTAKPQDDDIIRSKTIAKVTSTNVSCTYADGSYCVPCVLMAC